MMSSSFEDTDPFIELHLCHQLLAVSLAGLRESVVICFHDDEIACGRVNGQLARCVL